MPKVALSRFQHVISQSTDRMFNHTERIEWLGRDNQSKWKHVYFSEPDLILHLRQEAVRSLSDELEKGHIINAHRLQPLPHTQQFSDVIGRLDVSNPTAGMKLVNKLLPNKVPFASVHSLNPSSGDVCCDQGKFYPGHLEDPGTPAVKTKGCWLWEFCGFGPSANHSDWNKTVNRHRQLLMHPFLSLDDGLRIPVVHHGQRVCTPKRDGTLCPNFGEA